MRFTNKCVIYVWKKRFLSFIRILIFLLRKNKLLTLNQSSKEMALPTEIWSEILWSLDAGVSNEQRLGAWRRFASVDRTRRAIFLDQLERLLQAHPAEGLLLCARPEDPIPCWDSTESYDPSSDVEWLVRCAEEIQWSTEFEFPPVALLDLPRTNVPLDRLLQQRLLATGAPFTIDYGDREACLLTWCARWDLPKLLKQALKWKEVDTEFPCVCPALEFQLFTCSDAVLRVLCGSPWFLKKSRCLVQAALVRKRGDLLTLRADAVCPGFHKIRCEMLFAVFQEDRSTMEFVAHSMEEDPSFALFRLLEDAYRFWGRPKVLDLFAVLEEAFPGWIRRLPWYWLHAMLPTAEGLGEWLGKGEFSASPAALCAVLDARHNTWFKAQRPFFWQQALQTWGGYVFMGIPNHHLGTGLPQYLDIPAGRLRQARFKEWILWVGRCRLEGSARADWIQEAIVFALKCHCADSSYLTEFFLLLPALPATQKDLLRFEAFRGHPCRPSYSAFLALCLEESRRRGWKCSPLLLAEMWGRVALPAGALKEAVQDLDAVGLCVLLRGAFPPHCKHILPANNLARRDAVVEILLSGGSSRSRPHRRLPPHDLQFLFRNYLRLVGDPLDVPVALRQKAVKERLFRSAWRDRFPPRK